MEIGRGEVPRRFLAHFPDVFATVITHAFFTLRSHNSLMKLLFLSGTTIVLLLILLGVIQHRNTRHNPTAKRQLLIGQMRRAAADIEKELLQQQATGTKPNITNAVASIVFRHGFNAFVSSEEVWVLRINSEVEKWLRPEAYANELAIVCEQNLFDKPFAGLTFADELLVTNVPPDWVAMRLEEAQRPNTP